jgi:hypothetical protein
VESARDLQPQVLRLTRRAPDTQNE